MPNERKVPIDMGLLLHQAYVKATFELNTELASLGLNNRQFATLLLLSRKKVASQRELVLERIGDKTTMVRTIDDLEKRGYLRRTPSKTDRRVNDLALTTDGSAAFKKAQARTQLVVNKLFAGFSPEETEAWSQTLRRFVNVDSVPSGE
jgi:DNA-binding MarR family transcriptional regulator